MMTTVRILFEFLRRDCYVQRQNLKDYIINYTCIQPLVWSVLTGYLQANTYFGTNDIRSNTILFSGTILLPIMIVTFMQAIELRFDLDSDRYVNYQITILSPFWILLERIFFSSFVTFFTLVPFYPFSKLLLGNYIDTSTCSWASLMLILYCASLCCSAYHYMMMCAIKSTSSLDSLWKRANAPMIDLGGLWIPWITLYAFSPVLGYLVYCNPLIYIGDGLKQTLIGGPEFLSLTICIPMLMLFTLIFTYFAWYSFKKRNDCL